MINLKFGISDMINKLKGENKENFASVDVVITAEGKQISVYRSRRGEYNLLTPDEYQCSGCKKQFKPKEPAVFCIEDSRVLCEHCLKKKSYAEYCSLVAEVGI